MQIASRHTDSTMMQCLDCGWQGRLYEARHGYAPIPPDDVEPMDYCPKCGSDQLDEAN